MFSFTSGFESLLRSLVRVDTKLAEIPIIGEESCNFKGVRRPQLRDNGLESSFDCEIVSAIGIH
jgi:hypothetical protein